MPDFVITAAVAFGFLTVTMYLGEDLYNEAGQAYNGNGGGIHAVIL